MSAQIALQLFRFGRDLPKLKRSGVLLSLGDRPAKFFLRRFAEPGQLRDAARVARFAAVARSS